MNQQFATREFAAPADHQRDWLLSTKLAPAPARATLLPRPRLIAQLMSADQVALTLVVAPAGFGKTTLVTTWCQAHPQLCAWVTLDAADCDPVRFWRYVVAALQTIAPQIGAGMLAHLATVHAGTLEPALIALINELADCPHDLVLILDDYHLIDTPVIHESLAFLLDHRPAPFHLLIASRVLPPLPVARLRARGQLYELSATDLRLTQPEALALMHDVLRLPLRDSEVLALATQADGWMTGMHLAALALRDHPDPAGMINAFSGSHRIIADYLLDEVVARQPAAIQAFLLHTTLLDRLSAPLCDAVTGCDTSAALLAAVERANLFLAPLDTERRWYRYHAWFAEALRVRVVREQPELARDIHHRAGAWLIAEGMLAEAIPHLLAVGALAQAADLLARLAEPLLLRGEVATLRHWLHALPDALIQARQPLMQARIFAQLVTGQIATLDADIQRFAAVPAPALALAVNAPALPTAPAPTGLPWLRDSTAALHMLAAILQDADPPIQRRLQQLLTAPDDHPQTADQFPLLYHGFAHWANGDVERARTALTQAARTYRRSGDVHGEVFVTALLAEITIQEGALHQAAQLYATARQLLDRAEGSGAAVAGPPAIGMGNLYYEWNDLDRARPLIAHGLQQATYGGRVDLVLSGLIARARLQHATGDIAGANATHTEVVQAARATQTPRLIAYAEAQQAAHWLNQGRHAAALEWARRQRMALDDEIGYLRELEYVTFARVLALQGAYDNALYLLDRLQAQTSAAGRMGQTIVVLLATALVQQARGDTTHACAAVLQALILAEPGGYLRTFVDAGPALVPALALACDQLAHIPVPTPGIGIGAYAQRVLAACQADWPAQPVPENVHAETVSAAPGPRISPRERDLLECIVAGMANKEIARQLGLTPGTVKWYLAELYAKLDVCSRTQALARARALGLLR
jgi:LuxR family transcriptional regulator, maltose regulon positive regulatory protein